MVLTYKIDKLKSTSRIGGINYLDEPPGFFTIVLKYFELLAHNVEIILLSRELILRSDKIFLWYHVIQLRMQEAIVLLEHK